MLGSAPQAPKKMGHYRENGKVKSPLSRIRKCRYDIRIVFGSAPQATKKMVHYRENERTKLRYDPQAKCPLCVSYPSGCYYHTSAPGECPSKGKTYFVCFISDMI